jgi:hypothetical protein
VWRSAVAHVKRRHVLSARDRHGASPMGDPAFCLDEWLRTTQGAPSQSEALPGMSRALAANMLRQACIRVAPLAIACVLACRTARAQPLALSEAHRESPTLTLDAALARFHAKSFDLRAAEAVVAGAEGGPRSRGALLRHPVGFAGRDGATPLRAPAQGDVRGRARGSCRCLQPHGRTSGRVPTIKPGRDSAREIDARGDASGASRCRHPPR